MREYQASKWRASAVVAVMSMTVAFVGPAMAIEQITSASYTVGESAINNGGGTRNSAGYIVWTDSIGEGIIGVYGSASYVAYMSFVPAAAHSAGVPVVVSSFRLE
jgi:hypothetical protein